MPTAIMALSLFR